MRACIINRALANPNFPNASFSKSFICCWPVQANCQWRQVVHALVHISAFRPSFTSPLPFCPSLFRTGCLREVFFFRPRIIFFLTLLSRAFPLVRHAAPPCYTCHRFSLSLPWKRISLSTVEWFSVFFLTCLAPHPLLPAKWAVIQPATAGYCYAFAVS